MSNNQAPDLIAAARAVNQSAFQLPSLGSKEGPHTVPFHHLDRLNEALAALPADARIVPRQLLLMAAGFLEEGAQFDHTPVLIKELRQAARESKP